MTRKDRALPPAAMPSPAETTLTRILDSLPALIYVADMQTHEILFANRFMEEALGKQGMTGQICWQAIQTNQTGPCSFCTNHRIIDAAGKPTEPYVWQFQNTVNKCWYHIHDRAIEWVDGRIVRLEIATDITGRVTAEGHLQRLSRIYAALSQCNQEIFRCRDETELFTRVCRAVVEFGGMSMAWIGLLESGREWVQPVAGYGSGADDDLIALRLSMAPDNPERNSPTLTAIRESRPVWYQDFIADSGALSWSKHALRFGWAAAAALPLYREGVVVGNFTLYASELNAFDEAARNLLVELASGINLALERFDQEKNRRNAENALRIVAEELSVESGAGFFQALALRLAKLVEADFAIVGELETHGDAVTTLGWVNPEGVAENLRYHLANTPCAAIFESGLCIYRSGVAMAFPEDTDLLEMGAEAYVGVPLRDDKGTPIGLIAALWRRPLRQNEHPEHILRIFSARAAAELIRSKAENALRLTRFSVEAASDGLFWITPGARFVDVNLAASQLLGYSREELLQRGVEDIDMRYSIQRWPEFFDKLRKRGSLTFESTLRRRDGSLIPVEVVAGHVRIGTEERNCSFVRDITERKRAKEELLQLNEELELRVAQRTEELLAAKDEAERANLSKSEFLSSMSHELRTPLNAILGFSQLLKADPQAPLTVDQSESLDEILRAGNHLLALISEVLDLARIESGRLELTPEAVELAPLFQECLSLVRPLAEQRGVQLVNGAPDGHTLRVDRLRLRQLLLNLLSNAIKYNHDGGRVGLECYHDGEQIRIAVRDSGIGIAPEFIPRLFKPFERHGEASRRVEGTGIGLALCKRLVEAMGGSIAVDSKPGVGSVFRVIIPSANAPLPTTLRTSPTAESPSPTPASSVIHTVLYVEDNPANLRLVQKIVAQHPNLRMIDAPNAEIGLELACNDHPDLILMDIGLPGMSGVEALHRLRAHPELRDIPVIALSANAMPDDIACARAAGFDDYLTKPLDVTQFKAIFGSLTTRKAKTHRAGDKPPSRHQ